MEIDTKSLGGVKRRQKEFFELMHKALGENGEEARKTLLTRFGTNIITLTEAYESVSVHVDGEMVFKR